MEVLDCPYKAEYAKSGRSSCKACRTQILQDSLRLAVMIKSPKFDGMQPNWYHHGCFFSKQRPKDVSQIQNFDSLKWADQEKIRSNLNAVGVATAAAEPKGKKGKATKRSKKQAVNGGGDMDGDFCVEYAKSSRAMCRGCEVKIAKEEVRISKKDYESEDAKRYGGKDLWHHVDCFAKLRSELGFWATGNCLPGFSGLRSDDQKKVQDALPKIEKPATDEIKDEVDGGPSSKKVKKEAGENGVGPNPKDLKKQAELLSKYADKLKALKRKELVEVLEYNDQQAIGPGELEYRNQLSDCMAFGGLAPCKVCGGQLSYKTGFGYQCTGSVSEWSKCTHLETKPDRFKLKIPTDVAEDYNFLGKYKPVIGTRLFVQSTYVKPSTSAGSATDSVDSGPKIERFAPLRTMSFFPVGNIDKESLKRQVVKLGGTLASKLTPEVTAIIATKAAVDKGGSKMEEAEDLGLHVVPVEFVTKCEDKDCDVANLIDELTMVSWGRDLKKRIEDGRLKSGALMKSLKSKSQFTKSMPSKMTLKVKEGLAVDPDSGLADTCHVFRKGSEVWEAVLSKADVQTGQNSYYKLQLLAQDKGNKYYVFRSWGRIGTTIGGTKTESHNTLEEAKREFRHHYEDKTGNSFEDRDNFVKMPNAYYPVEISYSEDTISLQSQSSVPSKLPDPVQELVTLLYDTKLMKKVMMEFELDLEKMPLGKLSRKQLTMALSVLGRLQNKDGDVKPHAVVDASNQFYTLVPHDFGMQSPPLLDNPDIIKTKIEMIESLLEMEVAYSVLKESGGEGAGEVHPIDHHYTKLNTEIEAITNTHEEFSIIEKYVRNTHAATHKHYELEISQLFKIKRVGEDKRFKPFKKLHNRKLLWHGSRLTNFVGILSQGLRIAPPEAPVTGYMFGKGIYFADMVSKSANYCMTSKDNSTGLLLLCEVALGDMYERTHAEYIQSLPSGKHSCKGIGVTSPDPQHSVHIEDGLEVPLGPPVVKSRNEQTSLLYNEYIVYDPAQVRAKYLLKVDFKYKY